MSVRLIRGDCRAVLPTLPERSVHAAITSPPYFGLRAYSTDPQTWGGTPDCDHDWTARRYYVEGGGSVRSADAFHAPGEMNAARLKATRWREDDTCARCGAWRGELGREPTPALYVAHLVEVFRAVRRVLRDDGTLWLNLGDSYNAYNGNAAQGGPVGLTQSIARPRLPKGHGLTVKGLPAKNLLGIPWRVAFALQDDGWILRSEITWCKVTPMPESVGDRPTSATEKVFLFSKQARYFYDSVAVRQPSVSDHRSGNGYDRSEQVSRGGPGQPNGWEMQPYRNLWNYWLLGPQPFPEAHFATFPPALIEPMVLAGCPAGGTVLDPFGGAGTVGLVGDRLGRNAILVELNPKYVEMARRRIEGDAPLLVEVEA